ncbi:hypothetical protein ACGFZB_11935 [Streptomyces cinerochromogenes]|uniref:Secreted protein n=1 Tax=Streptomyces cinerochromogenes TaxID=66422 RepID=A0ABW7B641_9ACTN
MKSMKVAAALAGSLIAVGVAAPAFAAGAPDSVPATLSGALDTKVPHEVAHLQAGRDLLATDGKDSLVHTVKEAATTVNHVEPVHGKVSL